MNIAMFLGMYHLDVSNGNQRVWTNERSPVEQHYFAF